MASSTTDLTTDLSAEFNAFAEPLIASGRYISKREVLHAAMDALRISELGEEEATGDWWNWPKKARPAASLKATSLPRFAKNTG